MTKFTTNKRRRWSTVWGRPGMPIAYVEQKADCTFAVIIAGKLCGHFASEETARDFAQQIMATPPDDDRDQQKKGTEK